MSISFLNAQIFQPDGFVKGDLHVKDGIISNEQGNNQIFDCQGMYLCPGLIDLQVNGIAGIDFTTSLEKLADASSLLLRSGVTSFLATIVSQPLKRYREIIKSFSRAKCQCLGLHLEGPHINPKRRGAHPFNAIQETCAVEFWDELADPQVIKMVTLAPELSRGVELIELLHRRGIVVSCGHSAATVEQLLDAKKHGLSCATHLFNAMQIFHQRAPGIVGYVLGRKTLRYTLIVDGVHLHPDTVAMAYNANPDGLILISDSTARTLGELSLESPAGKKVVAGTDTLAGSACSLLDCVNMLQRQSECSWHGAIQAASTRPAELLGLGNFKGKLLTGYDADLIVLDETGSLRATFIAGKQVYP